MTNRQQQRYAELERRAKRLEGRVSGYRVDGNPSRARAELAAVRYAQLIIRAADHEGILDDLETVAAPQPDLSGALQRKLERDEAPS